MVQLTAYTTNDKTAPLATTLLNLNGKLNLVFSNIMFVAEAPCSSHAHDSNSTARTSCFLTACSHCAGTSP